MVNSVVKTTSGKAASCLEKPYHMSGKAILYTWKPGLEGSMFHTPPHWLVPRPVTLVAHSALILEVNH